MLAERALSTVGGSVASRLYRLVLLAFPRRMRAPYGDEMSAAFWRPGGVASLPPRGPLGRALQRGRDACGNEIGFDLRLAWRSLRSTPVFSVTVILILGLGVGLNAALSTAVKAALLQSAPFPEPDRLMLLVLETVSTENPGPGRAFPWSYPKYEVLAATEALRAE